LGLGLSGLECLSAVKELPVQNNRAEGSIPGTVLTYYIFIVQNFHLQKGFNTLNGSTLSFMSKIVT
jgi:hypothetical protein